MLHCYIYSTINKSSMSMSMMVEIEQSHAAIQRDMLF